MSVSDGYVKNWIKEWKGHIKTRDEDWLENFGLNKNSKPTEMAKEEYLHCFNCRGSYKDFRDAKEGDVGEGHTIQSILDKKYDLDEKKTRQIKKPVLESKNEGKRKKKKKVRNN